MKRTGRASVSRDDASTSRDGQQGRRDVELGARLRDALGTRSQKWLSDVTGISTTSISNIASGSVPFADNAIRIADALGVSVAWLINGTGARRAGNLALADEADWLFVPRFEVAKMMSLGARPEPEEVMPIRRDVLARHISNLNGLWITRMVGSALPSVAASDDLILCRDVVDRLEDGRPYIFAWPHGVAFRRVRVRPDGLELRTERDGDEMIFIPAGETDALRPVGRILGSLAMRAAP